VPNRQLLEAQWHIYMTSFCTVPEKETRFCTSEQGFSE